jgi:hypothetical protein
MRRVRAGRAAVAMMRELEEQKDSPAHVCGPCGGAQSDTAAAANGLDRSPVVIAAQSCARHCNYRKKRRKKCYNWLCLEISKARSKALRTGR